MMLYYIVIAVLLFFIFIGAFFLFKPVKDDSFLSCPPRPRPKAPLRKNGVVGEPIDWPSK